MVRAFSLLLFQHGRPPRYFSFVTLHMYTTKYI